MGVISTDSEEWKRLDARVEEINKRRGCIIALALEIEDMLEGVISSYLMKEATPEKKDFFELEVMRPKGFEEKIQIFEKICKKELFDTAVLRRTLQTMKSVQEIRNKVAHWRTLSFLQTGEVYLRYKDELEKEKMFSLTLELLGEIEKKTIIAKQGMVEFHHWHYTLKQ
jgi:hypothetical protein